jgi:hypothetical protein
MSDASDAPRIDPSQADREAVLGRIVRKVVLVAAVLGSVGILLGDGVGDVFAGVALAVIIALPLLRVVWLVATWMRQRDLPFVALGTALLGLVALGFVLALLRR